MSMIGGSELVVVGTSCGLMLVLYRRRLDVVLVGECFLFGSWARADSATATVEAHV
jgi:hypothetical protein